MTLPKARTVLAVISVIGYILITGGFFYALFGDVNVEIFSGETGKQLLGMFGMVVGTWGSIMGFVFTFHFGTSQSSSDKNDIVKKALEK